MSMVDVDKSSMIKRSILRSAYSFRTPDRTIPKQVWIDVSERSRTLNKAIVSHHT